MTTYDPYQPYNDLPGLPPPMELETKSILKNCILAREALAELNQSARLLPNSAILINSIPLLEAQASSEIENIVTTSDELFRQAALADDTASPQTKEALRYRTALKRGFEQLTTRPLTVRTAVEVCSTIKGIDLTLRRTPGVSLKNSTTGETVYTPPDDPGRIQELMSNWERFINENEELDHLVVLAVQHYQFEAIHPFIDGNGRTGRVLNALFLVQRRLLELPLLYLSKYILRTRSEYYSRLAAVTSQQRWHDWIMYLLLGIVQTALETRLRIESIHTLQTMTGHHIEKFAPRIHSRELVDAIFTQPYCRISDLVNLGIAKRQTASTYLQAMAVHDVLVPIKRGREKIYLNRRLLQLLSSDAPDCDTFERLPDGRYCKLTQFYSAEQKGRDHLTARTS